MTAMSSRHLPQGPALARCQPCGRRERGGFAGLHRGQAGEHVDEVLARVDTQAAAVDQDGVEHRGGLAGFVPPDKQPVFRIMQNFP